RRLNAREGSRLSLGEARQEAPARLPQFRCSGCNYRASRRIAPERCPMCGGSAWELDAWRPFSNAHQLALDTLSVRESRTVTTTTEPVRRPDDASRRPRRGATERP